MNNFKKYYTLVGLLKNRSQQSNTVKEIDGLDLNYHLSKFSLYSSLLPCFGHLSSHIPDCFYC